MAPCAGSGGGSGGGGPQQEMGRGFGWDAL